tara:strand:- start:61 stop:1359 length:1299 start_codon:yes stop_codon:yes gene_type:complete
MKGRQPTTRGDLLSLTFPLIVGSLLEPIASVIDNAFVGNLSTKWLAALAFGTMLISSVSWIFNFIVHVTTESISRVFGGDNREQLVALTQVVLLTAFFVGVTGSIAMYLFHPILFSLIGVSSDLEPLTQKYFFIRLLGQPFSILFLASIALLRGVSQVKVSMIVMLCASLLNSGINYYLLYFLNLSPEYAAWGTNISMVFGFLSSIFIYLRKVSIDSLFDKRYFKLGDILQFSSKSKNLFLRSSFLTAIFFISTHIAGTVGVVGLAAHQILLQFWLFSSFFIDGVASLANIYVSRWSNNRDRRRVRWLIRECYIQGVFFACIFSVVYFLFRDYLFGWFTQDPLVVSTLVELWPLVICSQLINAIAFIIDGCLFGDGAFRFLRNMMFFILLFVFLPFAYYAYTESSIRLLWVGLIFVSLFRVLIGWQRVNRIH